MTSTRIPSDRFALVAKIDPDAHGVGAVSSGWVDASDFHKYLAVFNAGVLGASATLDGKIEQAQDNTGTGAKDVTGKAITQLVKASNDSDSAMINLNMDELDVNNGFNHIRITMTIGAATSDADAELWGMDARQEPASDNDDARVVEIVT